MKKILIRVLLVLVVLVIAAVVVIGLSLNTIIKKGVETVGPQLTQVEIKLDGVSLSLFSGSGAIKGLDVGNPKGYKTPSAIKVGSASLALQPSSLLSDKVVVRSVNVQAPEITFEGDLGGNNLSQILKNIQAATGGGGSTPATNTSSSASKKLQVDEFVIAGGRINLSTSLLGGKAATVPLPDIHLTDLGTGPEGITAAELTSRVMKVVTEKTLAAVGEALGKAGTEALKGAQDAGKGAVQDLQKSTKGVTDLFKKK